MLSRVAMTESNPRVDILRPRLFLDARPEQWAQLSGTFEPQKGLPDYGTVTIDAGLGVKVSFPVPKGWEPVITDEPGTVAAFGSPEVSGPKVVLHTEILDWEVDPLAWLMYREQVRGVTVTLARPVDGELRHEVGGLREHDRVVWRSVVIFHGKRAFTLRAEAPHGLWEELQDMLRRSLLEFRVLEEKRAWGIEARKMLRTQHIGFSVPASWLVRARQSGDSEVFVLGPTQARGRALLRIESSHVGKPAELRERRILESLLERGWVLEGCLTRQQGGIRTFSPSAQGTLVWRERRFHLRIAHRRLGNAHVDYTVVLPVEDIYAIDAMRTSRAMEIAAESTMVHPSGPMPATTMIRLTSADLDAPGRPEDP